MGIIKGIQTDGYIHRCPYMGISACQYNTDVTHIRLCPRDGVNCDRRFHTLCYLSNLLGSYWFVLFEVSFYFSLFPVAWS